jgi:hypothetical protein
MVATKTIWTCEKCKFNYNYPRLLCGCHGKVVEWSGVSLDELRKVLLELSMMRGNFNYRAGIKDAQVIIQERFFGTRPASLDYSKRVLNTPEISKQVIAENIQEGGAKRSKDLQKSTKSAEMLDASLALPFKLRGHKLVKKKDVFGDYNEWKEN